MKTVLPLDCPPYGLEEQGSLSHVFTKAPLSGESDLLPPHVSNKISKGQDTSIVVVGGGLASAQVVHLANNLGVSKIHLLLRVSLKTKHFNADLKWVAKHNNRAMGVFYGTDTKKAEGGTKRREHELRVQGGPNETCKRG